MFPVDDVFHIQIDIFVSKVLFFLGFIYDKSKI